MRRKKPTTVKELFEYLGATVSESLPPSDTHGQLGDDCDEQLAHVPELGFFYHALRVTGRGDDLLEAMNDCERALVLERSVLRGSLLLPSVNSA